MKVNYDIMLRHAEHDLEQAENELRQFRMNSGLSVAGNVRKETLRGMIGYKNALFQRVENLKKDMRA
ncbi:hypothetical protein EFN45_02885 [Leuconostoc citreum]|uniref:hypothetical protein n=1 Tax=Leuconostoc citreum TaxID=33964 RepID=UPI0021A46C99|nr:hypothetical protein [Leuconostoc citreum]MCT3069046.1 hypothetical protein [Leuconostoc citreum]